MLAHTQWRHVFEERVFPGREVIPNIPGGFQASRRVLFREPPYSRPFLFLFHQIHGVHSRCNSCSIRDPPEKQILRVK